MRRHAKASTAGSTQRQATGLGCFCGGLFATPGAAGDANGRGAPSYSSGQGLRGGVSTRCSLLALVVLAALSLTGLLFSAPLSSAAVITDRPALFTFNSGETSKAVRDMAVDESTGSVYVISENEDVIAKFNANGEPANFSALGSPFLPFDLGSESAITVDDFGANPGRIFVSGANGQINAYSPAGQFLWQLPSGTVNIPGGVAVDTAGNLWVSERGGAQKIRQFASTGSPPAEVSSFVAQVAPWRLDLDASGNVYVMRGFAGRTDKYVGGVFDSILDPALSRNVTVNQSSPAGHIFVLHNSTSDFNEYESTGALVGTFGADSTLSEGQGIGYNPTLDRVYAANFRGLVTAFGPVVTGTVPDPTIEATTAIGVYKATHHGKVNPQSVPNAYYFQWKKGTGASWAKAQASSPQSLPEDSTEHTVEFPNKSLFGNTTYQVRLIGENTTNGLRSFSAADTFTTAKAAAAPIVTIDPPSSVGTTTATVSGTVDPEGDTAEWRVQLSTDPGCATGFTDEPLQALPEGSEAPVNVSYDLTGLLPAEHYCARITATNSFGTTTSEVKEFETDPIVPDAVETAFVAPRLDTSARLNGRVNPQGAPLTYRFEYSDDGGTTWIALPDLEDQSEAREVIVVGQELAGLSPDTAYQYRLGFVENDAGPAAPSGGVRTFTTRTSDEVTLPERGIEMVSNPDKGNQHALAIGPFDESSPLFPDGNKALWTVVGGAPGSNTGTLASFLAERTSSGWRSKSLVPPADQQVGGGRNMYRVENATPDWTRFISFAAKADVFFETPQMVVRLDADANQEVLATYTEGGVNEGTGLAADITDDAAHVVAINVTTRELEDIGSGPPELISVMPDGSPASCPFVAFMDADERQTQPAGYNFRPGYHRIATDDASRVYFQVSPNGNCSGPEGLYVRNREAEETSLIDPGVSALKEPRVIRATPDGGAVYFASFSSLDPADGNESQDLYRWDEASGESTCLTCQVHPNANIGIGTLGDEVLVSDDFSHFYFSSNSQLIPGQGIQGRPNIYAMSGGDLHFVANATPPGSQDALAGENQSLLSADGDVLVFVGTASQRLTADKVAEKCSRPTGSLVPCEELYRYDDRDGSLECLSCVPGGLTTQQIEFAGFKMSADGSTVAFVTRQRLAWRDVNNDIDIYEWRNGSRRLITDGVTDFQEGFGSTPTVSAVDADGSDILFSLVAPGWTGFEQDGLANVYDARIGGGFEPSIPPAHCSEDSCQGPLQAPPGLSQPASASFSGRGNIEERSRKKRRCAAKRGKAKRRCIRKQRRRSQNRRIQRDARRGK